MRQLHPTSTGELNPASGTLPNFQASEALDETAHPPPLRPPTQPLEAPGKNIARSIVVVHHGLKLLSARCVVQGVLAHLEVQLPPRQGVAQDDHVSMTPPCL